MSSIMERAKKIRNLYNNWLTYSKEADKFKDRVNKAKQEFKNATFSESGYAYSNIFKECLTKKGYKMAIEKLQKNLDSCKARADRAESRMKTLLE